MLLDCLLGCNAAKSGRYFADVLKDLLPPSSGLKSKQSQKIGLWMVNLEGCNLLQNSLLGFAVLCLKEDFPSLIHDCVNKWTKLNFMFIS
jgi:hypothetical protein